MKTQRVAVLLHEFPVLTETFILNQIVFLIQQGVDVQVFTLYPGDFDNLHEQFKGFGLKDRTKVIAVIPKDLKGRFNEILGFFKINGFRNGLKAFLKCINPFHFGLSGLKLSYFSYYTRLYGIRDFDLVHVHFGQMGAFYAKYVSSGLFCNVPYMVSFHGFDLIPSDQLKNRRFYSQMFRTARLVTVNSNYTRELLEKVNPNFINRIRLLPESLDTKLFQKQGRSTRRFKKDQTFKMVFLGRLVDWKGPDTALEIISRLVYDLGFQNVELSIIGKGSMQSKLEEIIQKKKLTEHVKLLGAQDQSNIKLILNDADLFIYTGREQEKTLRAENQGLVLMEAQAMGLPIVAFDAGGVGEGIKDQITGILVSSGEVELFAQKVKELLMDEERRIEMGQNGQYFIQTTYDIEILGKELLKLYEEALS